MYQNITLQGTGLSNGKFHIVGPCVCHGKDYKTAPVTKEQYESYYRNGDLVQKAFPTLSSDDREFIISGYCPKGWKELYGTEEE